MSAAAAAEAGVEQWTAEPAVVTALRKLTAKLAVSGLPSASEASAEVAREESSPTVEGIVRLLTRAKGSMLAQTLLDSEFVGGVGRLE